MDFVKKTPLLEIYIILIFFSLSITINSIGLIPKYLVILFFNNLGSSSTHYSIR